MKHALWTIDEARETLSRYGQAHVLAHFDGLAAAEKIRLLSHLSSFDFPTLARAWTALSETKLDSDRNTGVTAYDDIIMEDDHRSERALALGKGALRAGRLAILLVAGGQGTRLGFDGPKGDYRLGPLSGHSLFRLHAERIRALGRRYGVTPPLYIMTSPANHSATVASFERAAHFGLDPQNVRIFCQGVMPAFDAQGKLLLSSTTSLAISPNGNGGVFSALSVHGILDIMRTKGIDIISYIQVDNALARPADPRFVGYHLLAHSDFSCKAVAKTDPFEAVGNFARRNGRPAIVEYTEIPPVLATARTPTGRLRFGWGNPGLFIWSRDFLERAVLESSRLPVHCAHKKVPYLDSSGRYIIPDRPNAFKLETFALDALPHVERAIVLACERDDEFAPVKNASGADSPDSARALLVGRYRRWLASAGADIAPNTDVEISPHFALDAAELRKKIAPGLRIEVPMFFDDAGLSSP